MDWVGCSLQGILWGGYNQSKSKRELLTYIRKIGVEEYISEYKELHSNNTSYILDYKGLELCIVTNNWAVIGCDRGGEIESLKAERVRTAPCIKAIRSFNIDYKGQIKSCCNNYFGDIPYYGSIEDEGILNSYFQNLREFRMDMFKFGAKKGGCMYCNEFDNAKEETRQLRERIF